MTSWQDREAEASRSQSSFAVGSEEEELRKAIHATVLLRPHIDHVLQLGEALAREPAALVLVELGDELADHSNIVRILERVDDAEGLHVGLADDVLQLVELVIRVHRHEYDADPGRCEENRQPVWHIVGPDADMIALDDTDREEALGELVHALVEIGVGEPQVPVRVDDEFAVWSLPGPGSQEVADRFVGKIHNRLLLRMARRRPREPSRARRS